MLKLQLKKRLDYFKMIKINSLSKEYVMGDNKLLALNDVTITINKGEFVSIMGSSGSGKSTLMNIIGCLDVPSSGDYFFRDNNISSYNSNKLAELRNKDIGFVLSSSIRNKYSYSDLQTSASYPSYNETVTYNYQLTPRLNQNFNFHPIHIHYYP